MMTQPIRTFKALSSEAAPAGGNAKMKHGLLVETLLWMGRQWRRLVEGVKADFRVRAAEVELFRMTDRELADIGLSRAEIPFVVREVPHGITPELDVFDAVPSASNQNLRRAA